MASSPQSRGTGGRGSFLPRGQPALRGRGGGGRGGRHFAVRDVMEGLGASAVDTLDKHALRFIGGSDGPSDPLPPFDVESASEARITDVQYLGSYNWADERSPTIVVPGCPRIWQDVAPPYTLEPDATLKRGQPVYIDQNGHRLPSSPLLPLFVSVDAVCDLTGNAQPDWSAVEIVTDRNGLRKLLRWATGASRGKDFRIDLDLAGRMTVLMSRWEERTAMGPSQSFGLSFEHHATKAAPGCEGDVGHHRIITYDFDGLQMVVRFDVDACLPFEPPADAQTPSGTTDIDSLAASLATTTLSSSSGQKPALAVRHAGSVVPQTHIAELATRNAHSSPQVLWAELIPQLVLSQTPHHLLALHDAGTVSLVRKLGKDEFTPREVTVQPALRRLRAVLEAIQERVVEHGPGARLSLVCRNKVLQLFEREDGKSAVPEEVLTRFER